MKHIYQLIVIVACFILLVQPGIAQVGLDKIATSTMNFQLVDISPKMAALGDASVAFSKGAESIFFNPAAIVETPGSIDVKFFTTQWIADINYMAGAMAINLDRIGTFGLSFLWVDYGDIYGTSLIDQADIALHPDGYIDNGLVSNVGAYSLGISYAYAVSTQFFIGGNMRYVGQNLGQNTIGGQLKDNDATKLAFDAGVKYHTGFKSFRFGMAIRNFSSNMKREEISEQLPLLFTMGIAFNLFDFVQDDFFGDKTLNLALDFQHPNNYSERISVGLEYVLWDAIALRGGYLTNHDIADWSIGAGFRSSVANKNIEVDYSYSNYDIFDGVNRFSLGLSF
ncbi:PorV/PorQ family protein [candidate division KSB1 bacterium]|nr:PorV/PorQ family protein [candidate division KSB1 bacterium]